MSFQIRESADGLSFTIFVQPRASKNQVAGVHGDALKIRLTAPPVEGKANKMCTAFLARVLGVSKSAVEIVSGHTGRTKKVKIACGGQEQSVLRKRLLALAG